MSQGSQRLVTSSTSPDVTESLSARVKDPLWSLARQWQFGEFQGESGGMPVAVIVSTKSLPITTLRLGDQTVTNTPATPLEALVERESGNTAAPGWNSETLGYDFSARCDAVSMQVRDYDGRSLDWFDFDVFERDDAGWSKTKPEPLTLVPGMLGFPGAPEPRWWTMEDGAAYFDSAVDPEPNILSMLLPEVFYADVRNWMIVPAPVSAGHVRRVERVEVIDSFGVITEIDAVDDPGLSVFGLSGSGAQGVDNARADTRLLMVPNLAVQVVDCDPVEEVSFARDEANNMIWAHERYLTDPVTGKGASTGTEEARDNLETEEPGSYFTLKSDVAQSFIPYVPRQTAQDVNVDGAIALRRGRTQISATPDAPQYRGTVVAEAKHLHEETVPAHGLRVRRMHRFARGSDGTPHFWVGRDRDLTPHSDRPNLRFDYLRKEEGS